MIIIDHHIEDEVLTDYFFIERTIDINSEYFIEKIKKGEKMFDLTLVTTENGYALYEAGALITEAETLAEIGVYVVGAYGVYYNLELGGVA